MKFRGLNKLQPGTTILLILLFLEVVNCKAQSNTSTGADGPKISFESDTINYGTIPPKSDPDRTIKFTNTGTTPLIIESVVGDIVTPVKYPHEPIQPGQSAEIKVTYPTGRVGPFINFIAVTSNAPPHQKIIFVKGVVLPTEASTPAK
jgi:hypothetical protein